MSENMFKLRIDPQIFILNGILNGILRFLFQVVWCSVSSDPCLGWILPRII